MAWFQGFTRRPKRIRVCLGKVIESFFPLGVDMSFQLTDVQTLPLSVQERDAKGNPVAAPTDTFTYTVDRADLLGLVDNGDGSATVTAVGPLGTGNVNIASSTGLTGQLQIDVVASAAATIVIVPGTPVDAVATAPVVAAPVDAPAAA